MTDKAMIVEDPANLLQQEDHMREMQRLPMEVLSLARPRPSVTRVTGRIHAQDIAAWCVPNVAVRIEVDHIDRARAITRVYTIRQCSADRREIEIDFVLHDDDSPAMRWLRGIKRSDHVWLTGPRAHFVPRFPTGKPIAMFADDTALPALYAILQAWPEGCSGEIWIDSCEPDALSDLPQLSDVRYHLLPRGPQGSAEMALLNAAQAVLRDPARWEIWAAGERQEMRLLREYFIGLGLPRDALQILGYWKRGLSSSDLDRQRLAEYAALRAQNQTLDALRDIDLPV